MARVGSTLQHVFGPCLAAAEARGLGSLLGLQRSFQTSAFVSNDSTSPSGTPPSSSETPSSSASADDSTYSTYNDIGIPQVVVFGGSGFVGTRVCEQAVRMGADVVSVSRHGRPAWAKGSWADSVQWEKGDVFDPQQQWKVVLEGASGVVSTLGAFGSNELMYKMCGTANVKLIDAAAEAAVPRFAFISVHDYQFPGGWHAQDFLLKGYFQGKRDAEAHLSKIYPDAGVALRPGFIYGSRVAGSMTVPLGLIGAPLAAALKLMPSRSLAGVPILGAAFVPPVSVDAVGAAAVTAVLDEEVPPGVMDVWAIQKYSP